MNRTSLTTTLPYVNADPHIGFALEIIQADVIARWRRQRGDQVFFNTGTDEHGIKIFRRALDAGLEPQAYVDKVAAKFDQLKPALNLTYNAFTRTTDPKHVAAARAFWQRCDAAGDIYKQQYQVKYCSGCELEKTESELDHGHCILHPQLEIEILDEENYFFRFSKYQSQLLALYDQQADFIVPEHRLKEIRTFVAGGLQDFSISRLKEKMPWGVPVPGDEQHVMYVWFDALVNYISCLGWPEEKYSDWWPSIQFAGKDNLRQQAAMWQAMLLSAGIQPSKQIVIHGFLTNGGQKMSKSLGNVVDPFALVKQFGTDPVRYFLTRYITPFEDSDYSSTRLQEAYTSDLANGLGNLVSRVSNLLEQHCAGAYTRSPNFSSETLQAYDLALAGYRFDEALKIVWEQVAEANHRIDATKPWDMAKQGQTDAVRALLNELVNRILDLNELLVPFLPGTAEKIATALTAPVRKAQPLFPRLETPAKKE